MGASTRPNSKQPLERTVIELRYGVRILEDRFVTQAQSEYDIENIIVDGKKTLAVSYTNEK